MASQLEGDNQGSPTLRNTQNSPRFNEFLSGIRVTALKISLAEDSALTDEILNPQETELSDGEVVNITVQPEMFSTVLGL